MKSLFHIFLLLLLTVVAACANNGKSSDKNTDLSVSEIDADTVKTSLRFLSVEHDFGQVQEGNKVSHVFEVQNTGTSPLVILNVRTGCGCTAPRYDKTPIRPGRKGTIEIEFDTTARPGNQRKSVSVTTNTEPSNTTLTFTCEVIPAERSL